MTPDTATTISPHDLSAIIIFRLYSLDDSMLKERLDVIKVFGANHVMKSIKIDILAAKMVQLQYALHCNTIWSWLAMRPMLIVC